MRTPCGLLLLIAIAAAGCLVDVAELPESVRGFYEAYCEGDIDAVLEATASPFYLGHIGPQDDQQLRSLMAEDAAKDPADCSADAAYDFARFRSMTPRDVEDDFQVTITDQILGYKPGSSDAYVLVPAKPGHSPDDPLQGFWRPTASQWELIAIFTDDGPYVPPSDR